MSLNKYRAKYKCQFSTYIKYEFPNNLVFDGYWYNAPPFYPYVEFECEEINHEILYEFARGLAPNPQCQVVEIAKANGWYSGGSPYWVPIPLSQNI